jgi:hypothetical protein
MGHPLLVKLTTVPGEYLCRLVESNWKHSSHIRLRQNYNRGKIT